jgi:lauroyl/myristoyl acyltransferase
MVPWKAARPIIEWYADLTWRDADVRREAVTHMQCIVGATARAGEVDSLAREYVRETWRHVERLHRPWLVDRRPVVDLDLLLEARAWRGGVLLSFAHHGNFYSISRSLNRLGVGDLLLVVAPSHFAPNQFVAQQGLRVAESAGGTVAVNAVGSYARLRDRLLSRGTLLIAADVPGSTPVSFLGRQVGVASGTARLALETDALVVPITLAPGIDPDVQALAVHPPLDPRQFTGPAPLMQALLDVHAPAMLEWPAGIGRPSERFRHPLPPAYHR